MTYKTHIAGGALLTLTLSSFLHPSNLVEVALLFGCSTLGSLLPDIDHPESKINKYNPLSQMVGIVTKHREGTHSLLFIVIIGLMALVYKFNVYAIIGLYIGIFSHLLLDMMNPSGVPLMFPYKNRFRICKISTSSVGEWCVLSLLCVGCAIILVGF